VSGDSLQTITVTAVDGAGHAGWLTTSVILDNTPPQAQVASISESSAYAHANGTSVYYGVGSGNYTVQVHATDPSPGSGQAAGLDTLTFPTTTSGGASFDYNGETNVYRSRVYAFDASDTFNGDATVTAVDRAGNEGTATFSVLRDAALPVVTIQAVPSGESDVDVSWSATDGGAGLGACTLEVRDGDGPWQPLSTACAGATTYTGELGHGYTFRVTATDRVSNAASAEAEAVTKSITKYYYFPSSGSGRGGGQRVAMRTPEGVYYLHADHLGSTSLTTNGSGGVVARQLYHPFGTVRWNEGTLPTDFTFTGQRDVLGTGLVFMHARFYHPSLGRFVSADTIVPEPKNPQAWNRYSYVNNNPLRYSDPTGHGPWDEIKKKAKEVKDWAVDKGKAVVSMASGAYDSARGGVRDLDLDFTSF